jgi:hypothetical protein
MFTDTSFSNHKSTHLNIELEEKIAGFKLLVSGYRLKN